MSNSRRAWSPYKQMILDYVARHPGCSKWDVANLCTRSAQRCPSKQYYIVNTALRNGWIGGEQIGRQYRLYVITPEIAAKQAKRARNRPAKAQEPGKYTRMAAERAAKRTEEAAKQRRELIRKGGRLIGLDIREGYSGHYMYIPGYSQICQVPASWVDFVAAAGEQGHTPLLVLADWLDDNENGGPTCDVGGNTDSRHMPLSQWIRLKIAKLNEVVK